MTDLGYKDADVRLWTNEPLRWQRWIDTRIIKLPPTSQLDRDAEWGAAHGYEFTYWPDGSRTFSAPGAKWRIRL